MLNKLAAAQFFLRRSESQLRLNTVSFSQCHTFLRLLHKSAYLFIAVISSADKNITYLDSLSIETAFLFQMRSICSSNVISRLKLFGRANLLSESAFFTESSLGLRNVSDVINDIKCVFFVNFHSLRLAIYSHSLNK